MYFKTTLIEVLIMLLYMVPAYVLHKVHKVSEHALKDLSNLLLYICQPCLMAYSFMGVEFSKEILPNLAISLVGSIVIQIGLLLLFYIIFFKKSQDKDEAKNRVCALASVLGNIGFFGIPLLEALFPEHPEALMYCMMYILSMNVISWTIALYVMTGSKKYISLKGIFLNPPMIALMIIIPCFLCKVQVPDLLGNAITVLAKSCTPICMFILGIRLASRPIKCIFTDKKSYLTVALKMIVMPLVTFGVLYFLPFDTVVKETLYVLAACPCASIVLQFAELNDARPDIAANNILLSTIVSILTMPLLMLLL